MSKNYQDIQQIRRSQFITTYGPGSIIETKNGPRLIPSLQNGLFKDFFNKYLFEKYEIDDVRLCRYLAKGKNSGEKCRIFALPSNASEGKEDFQWLYRTQIFPQWKICYNKNEHEIPILYHGEKCPLCNSSAKSSAVRFVAACPNGHLDDINWDYMVHKGTKNCNSKYYEWISSGSSLSSITIRCPKCEKEITMKDIYHQGQYCRGRHPENERPLDYGSPYNTEYRNGTCNERMKITQRQSASLRIPKIITLLTIPKYDDNLSNVLQRQDIHIIIKTIIEDIEDDDINPDDFSKRLIHKVQKNSLIPKETEELIVDYITEYGFDNFLYKFKGMDTENSGYIDMMNEEYESLVNSGGNSKSDHFQITPSKDICLNNKMIPDFTLAAVTKIRTVTAQLGYTRLIGSSEEKQPKLVPVAYITDDKTQIWFPGFEGFGEGIFLNFDKESLEKIPHSNAYNNWINFKPRNSIYYDEEYIKICALPEYVWLHSLSHVLLKAISEFTGYSVTAIRERVYYDNTKGCGGILIYNTTPGDDGSLGGLTSLTNDFKEIVDRACELIITCSNDPLCYDIHRNGNSENGSACYGCLLIPETSCDQGNRWLDRHIFFDEN